MAKVLVVGGAGYVGSAVSAWLLDQGFEVWVLDDLSTGHRPIAIGHGLTVARAGDRMELGQLLDREGFDGVMHFAAFARVGESILEPEKYQENNVEQTRILLETLLDHGVRRFIFSSTCAIFGDPQGADIHERLEKKPINPYGQSKLDAERIMEELSRSRGLQAIALRYFNAAGAESKLRVGEWHEEESHLIPKIFEAAVQGTPIRVFGQDYGTPDGTCVRDYIHVTDLARAHGSALQKLLTQSVSSPGSFAAYNLGSEHGFSVLEVIHAVEKAVGRKIEVKFEPRREGDPARLVADATLAKRELGFTVVENSLDRIVESAWAWEARRRAPKKAVFLDRDGTLNEDPGYLSRPEQLKLRPGVQAAVARLKTAGFLLVVVSNQSGVGRGLIEEKQLRRIHNELDRLLGVSRIDHYEMCIHHPDERCDCRKPKPKLILDAATHLGIDLTASYMVGDKASDVRAGIAAHCRGSILVRTGEGSRNEADLLSGEAAFIAEDLGSAVKWILQQGRVGSED